MYLIPKFIRRRIEHRPNLVNIVDNIGWLFVDKFLRMGIGLFVSVWIARYLGPEQFGLMSYAMAFVALFGSIASLGLSDIVVRDLVKTPVSAGTTLGTAFVLQVLGALVAVGLAVIAIAFVRPDDSLTKLIVAVLSFAMVFKAADTVKYWFESQVQSKYSVWAENIVFCLLSAIKVGLILSGASLMAFVWAVLAEAMLVAVGLLVIYARYGWHIGAWSFNGSRARALLKDSWPLILSGLAIMVYMRIDQIMLGLMLGDKEVGVYSAAVRISEIWYFIPMAIVASVFPSILEAKKKNETLYYQRFQKLYDLMVLLAVAVALPMTFLSDWVVGLLFGPGYQGAGSVLAIHIWAGVFVALGVASGKWCLAENMTKFMFYRTLIGAFFNIVLNLFLIPKYGATGAAVATLVSYSIAGFWIDLFSLKTRRLFIMKLKSILLIGVYAA